MEKTHKKSTKRQKSSYDCAFSFIYLYIAKLTGKKQCSTSGYKLVCAEEENNTTEDRRTNSPGLDEHCAQPHHMLTVYNTSRMENCH